MCLTRPTFGLAASGKFSTQRILNRRALIGQFVDTANSLLYNLTDT
jgi:hypothetical protein